MPGTDVGEQHLPVAELDGQLVVDVVVRGDQQIGGLGGGVPVDALPHRVVPQLVLAAAQQLAQSGRAEDLDAREGGRAQHMIEVGVGERDMRHFPAQYATDRTPKVRAVAQGRAGVDDHDAGGPGDHPDRLVPARHTAPGDTVTESFPTGLFPSSTHTETLAPSR